MAETRYLKTYKTELDLSKEQEQKLTRDLGTLRFVYNLYLSENEKRYQDAVEKACPGFYAEVEFVRSWNKGKTEKEKKKFPKAPKVKHSLLTATEFYSWLKNDYIPTNHADWINETHNKALKQTVTDAREAFLKFFKGQAGYPKYKKKDRKESSYYFVRNGAGQIIENKRHYVQVPGLGKLHLKEKGYIPSRSETNEILSGRITRKNGKFYISVQVIWKNPVIPEYRLNEGQGEGIDLGVKEFAVCSSGKVFCNINRTKRMKRLDRKLRRTQKKVSRKLEAKKKDGNGNVFTTENVKGDSQRLCKEKKRLAETHRRMEAIRTDYRRKTIHSILEDLPEWIVVEDLNVSGMMKNRHLSKSIAGQQFYKFRQDLCNACSKMGIELRLADRYYASSKICHECGEKYNGLRLKDREWECPHCHHQHDRDMNAALNLRDTQNYTVWKPEAKKNAKIHTVMI